MSDVVNTCVAPFCHSQDHPGSVPIPTRSKPAGRASERSFRQFESLLGSREATRTRHRRIPGPHQHHPPAGPPATLDQFPFRRTHRSIRRLAGHRGLRQKGGFEILEGNQVVMIDHLFRPHPRIMPGLSKRLLLQRRRRTPGPRIPPGLGAAFPVVPSRHLPLRLGQLGGATLPMPERRQVVGAVGGGRCGRHTPIDTETAVRVRVRGRFGVAPHHEGGVPVPEAVPIHPDTGRVGRQPAGPHHRDGDTLRQHQTPLTDAESAGGVPERRQSLPTGFERRPSAALHREGVAEGQPVSAEHSLLCDLGAGLEPATSTTCGGKQFAQFPERRLPAGLVLMDRFVPQEPATMPFIEQCALGSRTRAQPVGVAHDLGHRNQHTTQHPLLSSTATQISESKEGSQNMSRTSGIRDRPYLPTAKAGGFSGGTP